MTVQIDTSTSARAAGYSNQRTLDKSQDGTLWAVIHNADSVELWYSKDGGGTWTQSGSLADCIQASMFIDLDDYLHIAYVNNSTGNLCYRRCTPNAGRTAWTIAAEYVVTVVGVTVNTAFYWPDIAVHRHIDGWKVHIAYYSMYSANYRSCYYVRLNISSGGTVSEDSRLWLSNAYAPTESVKPSIDFNHTGDGKTASSSPHAHIVFFSGTDILYKKVTYSGGAWSTSIQYDAILTKSNPKELSGCYNGSRMLCAYIIEEADHQIELIERATATTKRTLPYGPANGLSEIGNVSVTYDQEQNVYVLADGYYCKYTRATNAWSAWTQITAAQVNSLSTKRGYFSATAVRIEGIIAEGNSSPYSVKYCNIYTLNNTPNAPILTDHAAFDATQPTTLSWAFSDPDLGDSQGAYQLQILRSGDAVAIVDTGKVASAGSIYSLAASTLANGNTYGFRVRTWDRYDEAGAWSSYSNFQCQATPIVIVISPAEAEVLISSSVTPEWAILDSQGQAQGAYRLRLTDDADISIWDSGKTSDTVTNSRTIPVTLTNAQTYKIKVTVWNSLNIASEETIATFSTSFVAPAAPTITATGATSYITLATTNPSPVGDQPALDYNDIYKRKFGDTDWTRIATNVPGGGSYDDYNVASGQTYEYKAVAVGANLTTTDSATDSTSITLKGVWLHDIDYPVGTLHNYLYDGNGRNANWEAMGEEMLFAGRAHPVFEFGEHEQTIVNVTLPMLFASGDKEALDILVRRKGTVCYRDGRGRLVFGVIRALPLADNRDWGYTTTIDVRENDYSEEV